MKFSKVNIEAMVEFFCNVIVKKTIVLSLSSESKIQVGHVWLFLHHLVS